MALKPEFYEQDFITKVDEPDANTTYIGIARKGSATSVALWRIKKVALSGTVTTVTYASISLDQIWDNRTSLSYS